MVPDREPSTILDTRGISPAIGFVLLIVIGLILSSITAAYVLGLADSEDNSPNVAFKVTVDSDADEISLIHQNGPDLDAETTRIVWEIDGTRYQTEPAGSEDLLRAGDEVTFTFDGSTSAEGGGWTVYGSPGDHDISPEDPVTVALYDTESNKPVYRTEVSPTASGGGGSGGSGGELIWPHDDTAGKTDVTYEIQFTIRSGSPTIGNSLNSVEVDVTTGTPDMFTGTGQGNVITAGVDYDDDGTIDDDITHDVDDWDVSDGGSRVKIGFSGSAYTNPDAGETVIVRFDGVENPPSSGDYDAQVQTSGDGNWQSGTIEIGS